MLISGAELETEVMHRDRDFTKNGKGSISSVITQLVGPFALANMDGDAHRRLRAKLGDILSPARVDSLLDTCRRPLDDMIRDLVAGNTVDLVRVMRTLSGRLAMEMIGVTPDEGHLDQAALDIVALGERIAAEFRLSPTLGPAGFTDTSATSIASAVMPAMPTRLTVGSRRRSSRKLRALGVSFEEARGVVSIFFVAGTLTTALSLPRIVALLISTYKTISICCVTICGVFLAPSKLATSTSRPFRPPDGSPIGTRRCRRRPGPRRHSDPESPPRT